MKKIISTNNMDKTKISANQPVVEAKYENGTVFAEAKYETAA